MLLGPGDQIRLAREQLLDLAVDHFRALDIAVPLVQPAQSQVDDPKVWARLTDVGPSGR